MSDSPAVAPYLTVSSAFAATAFHASVFGVTSFWGTRYAALRDPFDLHWMLNAPLVKS